MILLSGFSVITHKVMVANALSQAMDFQEELI